MSVIISSTIKSNIPQRDGRLSITEVHVSSAGEAKASRLIATTLCKPVAHAPTESEWFKTFNEIVDPRLSAELVSISYLHCILKGLWRAPRITNIKFNSLNLGVEKISFMVSPYGCWGRPHDACQSRKIPIIMVRENKTIFQCKMSRGVIYVENYLEAVGVIQAMKVGISLESLKRPLVGVTIHGSR